MMGAIRAYRGLAVFALSLALASPLFASRLFLGTGGGYTYYSTDFENSLSTIAKLSLISDTGLSIDTKASLSPVNGLDDRGDFTLTSLLGGASYHFQKGGRRAVPYVGVQGGAVSTGGSFASPKMAYGVKMGVNLRVYQDLLFFFDYDNVTFTDSVTNRKVGSSTFSTGFSIKLAGQEPLARVTDISAEQRLREYRRNAQER